MSSTRNMSQRKILKKREPKISPWETPCSLASRNLHEDSAFVCCFQLVKQWLDSFNEEKGMPWDWVTQSKVFDRSVSKAPKASSRSSRPEVFCWKGVLKISSKFTGEHPRRSAISIKQLYWNRTSAWMFSCKFAAYFQNTFS